MLMMNELDPALNEKGLGGDLSGFLTNLVKALPATEAIVENLKNSIKQIQSIDTEMSKVVKSMGQGAQNSAQIKESIGKAYNEVVLMGGSLSDITLTQSEFLKVNARNVILSGQNLKDLIAVNKVTGLSAESLLTSFQNAGLSLKDIKTQMESVFKISNGLGVSAQVVSANVTSNLDKLNKFGFGNGIEGLAKMAAKAASLRINMEDSFRIANDIFERGPEAAIEISASLQRLGVASGSLLDPIKLLDLAQNNVPELNNQLIELSKQYTVFNDETKSFEIMPGARKQLNEVAKSLGMSYNDLAKMSLESSKLDKKLSEIDFSSIGSGLSEDKKNLIANLSEMNEKGEYVVQMKDENGESFEKAVKSLTDDDLKLLEAQSKQTTDMTQLAQEQLGAQGQMVQQQILANSSLATLVASTQSGQSALDTVLGITRDRYSELTTSMDTNNPEAVKGQEQMVTAFQEIITKMTQDGGNLDLAELTTFLTEKLGPAIQTMGGSVVSKEIDSKGGIVNTGLALGAEKLTTSLITANSAIFSSSNLTEILGNIGKILVKPAKDIAITADGQHYSLDKGDMLMAVNQQMLATAIGASSPSPILPTPMDNFAFSEEKKETTPKEIIVNVNFTHESKGADINVAQEFSKGLRDNPALQQQIVQTISQTLTNYNLTA